MRRRESSRIAAAIALSFACGTAREEPRDEAAPARVARRPVDAPEQRDAADDNKITITLEKPRPAGSGVARRCALGGDPIAGSCNATGDLAVDAAGRMYLVDGSAKVVRRYRAAQRRPPARDASRSEAASSGSLGDPPGEDCRFDPDGDPIALPPETKRMQPLDKGPVYMRSGGPDWHLATGAAGAILAHDYLGGLYRVDRGKAEPVCTDVFGFGSVAALGGKLLVTRRGLEQLTPGKPCTAKSAGIDDRVRGEVHAIRDRLYVAGRASDLVRFDGTARVALAGGTRVCSIVDLAPCGDGVCAIDNNCPQVIQLDADDKVVRTIKADRLFDTRPYGLVGAAAHAGDLLVLASHRAGELCEAAVYRVRASAFAP